MIHHIQMKVSTVLEMLGTKPETKRLVGMFEMSPENIRQDCEDLIREGKLYIPTAGCETTDPAGECLGHPSPGEATA